MVRKSLTAFQRCQRIAHIATFTMAVLRLLLLMLVAVAISSAANPNPYRVRTCAQSTPQGLHVFLNQLSVSMQTDSPSKQELVDMLRDRLHRLHTGVLQGHVINKKSDADRRLHRAGETLEQVRDYDTRGNTQDF